MSRIIVKNVPKYVTEDQLRGIFSRKGEITDVKLKRLSDGTSRQFAYIGFRNEQEAQDAITYFNKSFIDTLRISVLVADPPPRTQGKADEKSEHAYAKGDKKIKKKPEADHDPQLQEFLHEHKKLKFWSNDMCIPPSTGKDKVSPVSFSNGADDPNKAKRSFLDSKKTRKNKVGDDVSDMEYLKSRIKKNLSDSDSDYETDSREDAIHVFPIDGEVEAVRVDKDDDDDDDGHAMDGNDDVLDTSRLFVHGLPYSTTEEELTEHFSKFGDILEVHLVLDKDTRNPRGMAYVLYLIPESAKRAMEKLDKLPFQGRTLHILPAKPRAKSAKQVDNSSNLPKSFKQKREEQRKASEACGNTKAWNSFFMRPDTILENLVRSYGVTKSELLDRECEDPAVRLALGETKVIMETKEALAKAGVRVASLEEFAARKGDEKNRSKHILLVKNLPFASTEKELAQMFRKFASLDKIILPPTKTMALVVFLEPAEARAALNGMAYKRYKNVPLYLEWAPRDILEPKALADNKEEKSAVEENDARRVNLDQQVGIYSDIAESNVLHVKNLSFKTTDEGLKKHLTGLVKQGKILSVKIIRDWKRRRSSGYGFVEFDSVETATSVYRDLPVEGNVLDGHSLILSYSENKRSETVGEGSDKVTNLAKLHVKNVAFEATEKEVRQLFRPFGQVKRVRLPLKNVEKYAGFGFVEFGTMQEALNAKKAFSNTHFYGRHLVLEWAHDDKRKSCAAKYMDQENDNPKKRKRWTVVGRGRETSKKRL